MTTVLDSFRCRQTLGRREGVEYFSLARLEASTGPLNTRPYSIRALLDNMLRHEDGKRVTREHIAAAASGAADAEMVFHPDRVLLQDSSGLPVIGDLVALIEASQAAGTALKLPAGMHADLVVDHALEVDFWASSSAAEKNLEVEFKRHASRYRFLRWAEQRFSWLSVLPPGAGICHELNLEVLSDIARSHEGLAGVDTVVGTDSHTPMINALGVVGWGVGGIEATSVLLGEPIVMRRPEVVGVRLTGQMQPGILATDVALAITAWLRSEGVVGKIVEFCGPALAALTVPDRATIANMAPEYGATMGFFPADAQTLAYARITGRSEDVVAVAAEFLSAQSLLRTETSVEPSFDRILPFDLRSVRRSLAGPSRPEQLLSLREAAREPFTRTSQGQGLQDGDVVIAAITSCTNTANPRALATAGLLAREAVKRGLTTQPWVKTSFAPGSRIASALLAATGLQADLDSLGFQIVGHACTTCMGNSGPLAAEIAAEIDDRNVSVAAVLSGNRNFEGRIHRQCKLAYLMSPPLVVAYALAGTIRRDLTTQPLGCDWDGNPVFLHQLWPEEADIDRALASAKGVDLGAGARDALRRGSRAWNLLESPQDSSYEWEGEAGFIRASPFVSPQASESRLGEDILGARALVVLGDGVTTDHISPVSSIAADSEAGRWLISKGVAADDLGSFSARRLNAQVMLRGGFANPRLRNLLAGDRQGGITRLLPEGEVVPIHVAATVYRDRGTPLVVVGGARYGTGSARDWAAKVTRLLGVSAVLAESFERIHRTNLTAMGVLPLRLDRTTRLSLNGSETIDIRGLPDGLRPGGTVSLVIHVPGAPIRCVDAVCEIETGVEADWLRAGGVLPRILHLQAATAETAGSGTS